MKFLYRIAVIPQGIRFSVDPVEGPSRGYLLEVFIYFSDLKKFLF